MLAWENICEQVHIFVEEASTCDALCSNFLNWLYKCEIVITMLSFVVSNVANMQRYTNEDISKIYIVFKELCNTTLLDYVDTTGIVAEIFDKNWQLFCKLFRSFAIQFSDNMI